MAGQLAREKATLATLKLARQTLPAATKQIAEAKARVNDLSCRIDIQNKKQDRLKLTASRSGPIIPPPNTPSQIDEDGLPKWSGCPLGEENQNAFFQPQTLFCIVGDTKAMKATLIVDQSEIKLVHESQPVELMLDEFPGRRFTSSVTFVSRDGISVLPRELSTTHGGPIGATPNRMGVRLHC